MAPGPVKVIGLGAPVSVRIRVDAREKPVLRDVLDATITSVGEVPGARDRQSRDEAVESELAELRRMRRELMSGDASADVVEVVWPTVLAHGVLRDAVREAGDRLHDALADLAAVDVIGDALDALACCLATWSALRAVDHGGLTEVWL